MAFETLTFDTVLSSIPTLQDVGDLPTDELPAALAKGLDEVAAEASTTAAAVQTHLLKTLSLKSLQAADEHDVREALRVLNVWRHDLAAFREPLRKPRIKRPDGIGQLPVPRIVKTALVGADCGLCFDPIAAGDLTGRMRPPKDRRAHQAMGWLCRHCLFDRRETPRRRDILLRIFHHLFAASAVDLNGHECGVLLEWLTEDNRLKATPAWQHDPLDTTLVRLQTSVDEGKPATWIAVTTARTIIAVLQDSDLDAQDKPLLDAIAHHFHEWQTNPQDLEPRKYGTGTRYHAEVLKTTPAPTFLSRGGGPFDLHQAPRPTDGSDTETPAAVPEQR